MWKTGILAALVLAIGAVVVRSQSSGRSVEEPRYDVERVLGGAAEIRRYQPRIVAVTRVAGPAESAVNEGFRRLAGYIFGGNTRRAEIAMTAPVTQAVATAGAQGSERIAMTAPVTQAVARDGAWEVTFTMPAGSTMATLPVPSDERVTLREVPGERQAVLRYSGLAGPEVVRARVDELRALLEREGLEAIGEPVSARYDPPWTLPFLRRNEIWLRLADRAAD